MYFVSPRDGATVPTTFTVKMGVKGFEVSAHSVGDVLGACIGFGDQGLGFRVWGLGF